jgi:hypothetical protein
LPADISSSTAAPSEICDELPAVSRPSARKLVFSVASFSMAVPGRMVSSAVKGGASPSSPCLAHLHHRHGTISLVEVAGGGRGGAAVAFHREGVELLARQLPPVAQALGGFALAGQLVALGGEPAEGLAVDGAVAAHAHAAHVLGAASHDDFGTAAGDQPCGDMHGHFAGAALAVDGQAGDGHRPAGAQQRGARDVGRLLADLGDAAEDHVVTSSGLEAGAGDEFV